VRGPHPCHFESAEPEAPFPEGDDVVDLEARAHQAGVGVRQPQDVTELVGEDGTEEVRYLELVSRGEIVDRLWGKDVFVDVETGVHTAIRKIRRALHDSPDTPEFVETISGKGYRFIAPVEVVGASPAPPPPPQPQPQTGAALASRQSWRGWLIAGAIAIALGGLVTWGWQRARTTAAVRELQFQANFYRNTWGEAEIRRSIEYYDRVIALDPNSVDAHLGLATAWLYLTDLHVSPREAIPRARAAVAHILRRDETVAHAHVSLALIKMQYDWDFAGAEREFARALELQPGLSFVRVLRGWLRMAEGRLADAQVEIRRAVDEDPSNEIGLWSLGLSFYFAGQYDAAIEQYRPAIAAEPRSYWAHLSLGRAYQRQGRAAEAIAELDQARRLIDTPQVVAALVHAQAAAGRRAEAQAMMSTLREHATRKYVSPYDLATASAGLGNDAETLAWLEKAYEERSGWLALWIKVDPTFESLRTDARFRRLLERVGHTP
jgi:tetratricopeptide (TPR) repeat protein